MSKAKRSGPTGNEATAAQVARCRELLKEFGLILDDYDKRAQHNQANWAHAGDVDDMLEKLLSVVASYRVEYEHSEKDARDAVMAAINARI